MAQTWSDLGPPTSGQVHWGLNGSEEAFPLVARPSEAKKGPKRGFFFSPPPPGPAPRSTFRRSTFKGRCVKLDLPKSRSPLKVHRRHFFEFWLFRVVFGVFFWPGSRGKRFLGPVSPPVHLSGGRGTQIGPSGGHLWVWDPSLKVDRP